MTSYEYLSLYTNAIYIKEKIRKRSKKGWPKPSFSQKKISRSYFLVFFAVFGAAFFAVPHGPFDLQAIKILLFENSYTKISQPILAVNRLRGPDCFQIGSVGNFDKDSFTKLPLSKYLIKSKSFNLA